MLVMIEVVLLKAAAEGVWSLCALLSFPSLESVLDGVCTSSAFVNTHNTTNERGSSLPTCMQLRQTDQLARPDRYLGTGVSVV